MRKSPLPPSHPDAETERIQRWRWMMEQQVPFIGSWMHRRVATALMESALAGNWLAAQSLAVVFAFHNEADVRKMAGDTLRQIHYTTGIDAVWGVWAETRHSGLAEIALGYHRAAGNPASVRVMSVLCMGIESPEVLSVITKGSADLVKPLIQACDDHDRILAAMARQVITQLSSAESVNAICREWQASRSPFLNNILQQAGYVALKPGDTRLLSALKTNHLDVVVHGSADLIPALIEACDDADAEIAQRARQCLPHLESQSAIDVFCQRWSESRAPLLEAALLQAHYKARSPADVRILVALKTGWLVTAEKASAHGLPHLIQATHDPDETIRQNAHAALLRLKDEETREALCQMVIDTGDSLVTQIALDAGYLPSAPEQRALFYFLTNQWALYDDLDFDQQWMRAEYETCSPALRQRIAAQVQTAGRTDYLTILGGVDYHSRAESVSPTEADLMIRILAGNQDYARLWMLAAELSLPFSVEIVRILAQNGWQPPDAVDQPVFEALTQIVQQPMQLFKDLSNIDSLKHSSASVGVPALTGAPEATDVTDALRLPPALSRATLRISGRVNEVAFAPHQPVLAIATSQRKVVLWNFQTATIERVLEGFQHSVGKVRYLPDGTLICAERTTTDAACIIRVVEAQQEYLLGEHAGTVTVLEPVGANLLLTAGRDQRAVLWDVVNKKKIAEKDYPFWPRAAAVSPDQQYAALLHKHLSLVRMSDLSIVPGYPYLAPRGHGFQPGIAQNAAFSPDGKFLLTGQYNGQVGIYYHTSLPQRPKQMIAAQHTRIVRGIHFLPDHPILVTAGAEGQVRFMQWPELRALGTVYTPEVQITSLQISAQGEFMATGANDATLTLWDLRLLDIPRLFQQPLATATHAQIATTLALSRYLALPEPLRNSLLFLKTLLQYRFRFDIQVEEAASIQFGEFDIVLDET